MPQLLPNETLVPDEDVDWLLDQMKPCQDCGEKPHYVRDAKNSMRVRVVCTNPDCNHRHEADHTGAPIYYYCRWDAMDHWDICNGKRIWGLSCQAPG